VVEFIAARVGVPVGLLLSVYWGIELDWTGQLPSVALGTRYVLYAERTVALFYVFLLLFVPLVRAIGGQLPSELSAKGAKWERSVALTEEALRAIAEEVDRLSPG
jgi:hypothetical protein